MLKSRIALGLSHLEFTAQDLDARVDSFMDLLDADLDETRVMDVYRRAMALKENTFDLSVVELNKAWRQIKLDEMTVEYYKCHGCVAALNGTRKSCPFHGKRALVVQNKS